MTKSKSSGPFIAVLSVFMIHLMNGAKFSNSTYVARAAVTVISPFTNMEHGCNYHKDYILKLLYDR